MTKYLFSLLLLSIFSFATADDKRPNILWITIEDWSPDLSCYGTPAIDTPHVDKLASEGIRYQWAFTTSPVCSTSRSAMMTGFHQNYIGANQHREHNKQALPHGIKPIPHIFKDAGYYTALMSWKTDCNFLPEKKDELFEGGDWKERKPGQPFFARITFGGTHRSWNRDPERPIDGKDVELPPYYADTEFVRRDWANGLEQMQLVDRQIGELLQRVDDEGLTDNTIIIFIGDHGRCHIRGKQFLYDGGIRIPMIMRWPGKITPGQVSEDLVMSIDLCATILEAAGIKPDVPLHGKSLFSKAVKERQYIFAARDKMDETHDAMRAIRSKDHKLILNLMPERPWCQYNRYKEGAYPVLAEMNVMNLKGQLTPEQAAFFAPTKPEIELFNLREDPHEVNNLADDPGHAGIKAELLAELQKWRSEVIRDQGVSDDFRATDVFPASCPTPKVDSWVEANAGNYDFATYGWPAWYPTRTLEEWEKARAQWASYVFRKPSENVPRPSISHSKKRKKRAPKPGNFVGNWAVILPNGHAAWLSFAKVQGTLQGEIWTVGSPNGITDLLLKGDTLHFKRRCAVGDPPYPGGSPTGKKIPVQIRARVTGNKMSLEMDRPTADGSLEQLPFEGKRIPPLPPRPDLNTVSFGSPIELFNGRDLSGWRLTNPNQANGWKAVGGELVNETPKLSFEPYSKYGNLRTDREFEDFNLQLEFNVPEGGNSGVYLRGMYEAQVLDRDSRMQGIQGVGAIFGRIAPRENAGKPGGEWQRYDITLVDRHATVVLNGKKVIDNQPIEGATKGALHADDTKAGPIYLQGDHTAVSYRNIVLRPVLQKAKKTDPKLAVMESVLGTKANVESIAMAKKAGYSGIQLLTGDLDDGGKLTMSNPDLIQSFKIASAREKVEIVSLCAALMNRYNSWEPENRKIALSIGKQSIDACKAMEVPMLLVPFFGKAEFGNDPEDSKFIAAIGLLKELVVYAEANGVALGIESYTKKAGINHILKEVNSPYLKVYYDTGNMLKAGEDVYLAIEEWGPDKICQMHLKPFQSDYSIFGKGKTDLPKLATSIDRSGYQGWFVFEAGPGKKTPGVEFAGENLKGIQRMFGLRSH